MHNKFAFAVLLLVSLAVAGCGGRKTVQESTAGEVTPSEETGPTTTGAEGEGIMYGQPLADGSNPLDRRVVYFEYDSSAIEGENQLVVEAHSLYLVDHPNIQLVLEGHADERGTREYNLALGERRAQAVARMMQAFGVSSDRIQSVSYGEERPVALGHNESAWQLNRRVEILYDSGS